MPGTITLPEQMRRLAQFCFWLRLDERYFFAANTRTNQASYARAPDLLRKVLEWSWRQSTGKHHDARFSELGKSLITPKKPLFEITEWVFEQDERGAIPAGLKRATAPLSFQTVNQRLLGNWQQYIAGAYEEATIVSELAAILAPLETYSSQLSETLRRAASEVAGEPQTAEVNGEPQADEGEVAPQRPEELDAEPHAPDVAAAAEIASVLTPEAMDTTPLGPGAPQDSIAEPRPSPTTARTPALTRIAVTAAIALALALWVWRLAAPWRSDTREPPQQTPPSGHTSAPSERRGPSEVAPSVVAPLPIERPVESAHAEDSACSLETDVLCASLRVERGGKYVDVTSEVRLPSKTAFRFRLASDRPLHVALYLSDPDGTLRPLFPTLEHNGRESWLITPEVQHDFPQRSPKLSLDETPGEEHLLILASTQPLGRHGLSPEQALAQLTWPANWTPIVHVAQHAAHRAEPAKKRGITRGVDVMYTNSAPASDTNLVLGRFFTIQHTQPSQQP